MAKKIGFIGGGNMAEGIIGGLLGTKTKEGSMRSRTAVCMAQR